MILDPVRAASLVVKNALVKAFPEAADADTAVRLSDRADLQADLAMGLARRLKKAPPVIAKAIAEAIELDGPIEKVEIAGPGFLNLTLSAAWLAKAADETRADDHLGVPNAETLDRVVIDYSAPNVAKEMHVGHLRSTVIGDALSRLLEWRGHTVIRQNHLGDWGTPFGMLIEHLEEIDAGDTDSAVGELTQFYQAARKKFDEDPDFAERSRKRVVLLQAGDATTLDRWKKLVNISKRYFETIYAKLGVLLKDEHIAGESLYNPRLAPLTSELESSGKAKISDGALCVFPSGFANKEGDPLPLIIRKSDGGFGYATTDLAAVRYRIEDLKATRVLYCVGATQKQHFAMVFSAARDFGWIPDNVRVEHVMFGSVLGPDKKMFATRSGKTVRLIDLIDEATQRADTVIHEKLPNLDEAGRAKLAPQIGVGAIKYADLSSDRIKDYVFDVEAMVAFDGNSAGYVQYAHARIQSIIQKAGEGAPIGPILPPGEQAERSLILRLLGFGNTVVKVEATLEPHHLVYYLYELAIAFSSFYDKCPVIKAEPDLRASRLALSALTGKTIKIGLSLLGIDAPDRM